MLAAIGLAGAVAGTTSFLEGRKDGENPSKPEEQTRPDAQARAFPIDQLGQEAQKQYTGDGISITPTPEGARLRADFQDLVGEATTDGLWLESIAENEKSHGDRFRVRAMELQRTEHACKLLPPAGTTRASKDKAVFERPGLLEEYSASMDGVRQDFVVCERHPGDGRLSVRLEVTGAHARSASYGAKLIVNGSGREISYSRLHVSDATGRQLPASLQVIAEGQLSIEVDDRDAVYPVRIDPTFSDADWTRLGGISGTDGEVLSIAVDGAGNLYIGGDFSLAGEVAANNVAKWNGNAWSPLGAGTNNDVTSLAASGTDLYAGGTFTTAGGAAANRIAKWNGTAWSALGTGMNSSVDALVTSGTDLYAGGAFTTAGGAGANYIAKWNGTAWSGLGTGMSFRVHALVASGTNVYAGGSFSTAGGVSANRIAKWDGATWSALGSGTTATVYALAISGTDLYAGGDFTTAGGNPANCVAKWDGSTWSALGSGMGGFFPTVYGLAVSGTDVFAGGSFTSAGGTSKNNIARWDGTNWNAMGTGTDFRVNALKMSGADLCVGGGFRLAGGNIANGIATWNSGTWGILGSDMNGHVLALALSGSDLYAGGEFTTAGNVSASYVAKWNGTAWSALGSGVDGVVNALVVSGTDLYAGGEFTNAGGVPANRVARWDGTNWHAMGGGMNWKVHALCVSGVGLVYAGGEFTTADGNAASHIAKWNGLGWSELGAGTDGTVYALLPSGTDVYVGGSFFSAGGSSVGYGIAKWDGTGWSSLGSGTNNTVYALAWLGTDLYAGGSFTQAGGVTVNKIAKWDGTGWSALGTGMDTSTGVNALAVSGTDLYAGGSFNTAGGVGASRIARWNGSAWSSLGSGMNSTVRALAASGTNLYAGGDFYYAFGSPAWPFVAWAHYQPEIVVEQPAGSGLADGSATVSFGSVANGGASTRDFTIRNTGSADLTGLGISIDGANAGAFSVIMSPTAPIAGGGSTTFRVRFEPAGVGTMNAALHIDCNDTDENPFDITLTGTGLNTAPTITDITDVTLPENGTTGSLAFTVGDLETAPAALTLTGDSSNTTLVPNANIVFGGSGADRTVTITPAASETGWTFITITVSDGDLTSQDFIFVTVSESGTVALGASTFTVEEGVAGGVLNIPIVRSPGAAGDATVRISTTNGTAVAGAPPGGDFTGKANELVNLPEGATLVNVPITIHNPPGTNEAHETFTVTLSNATVATLGAPATATVRIMDSVDTLSPTAPAITQPMANATLNLTTGAPYDVIGTASDNKGVSSVTVNLNGTGPVPATLGAPGMPGTSWTRTITPATGTNTITVQSTDTFGRVSTPVTRTFKVLRPLGVTVSDATLGSVTAGFTDPSYREVGRSYTVTATAKPPTLSTAPPFNGAIFVGWTLGGVDVANGSLPFTNASTARIGTVPSALQKNTLTFIFREGMTLHATFAANRYPPMAGAYHGLIRPSPTMPDRAPVGYGPEDGTIRSNSTEGHFGVTLQSTGAFSGTLTIDGATLSFAGAFDHLGNARFGTARVLTTTVARPNKPSLVVALQTSLANPGSYDQITGTVTAKDFRQSIVTGVSEIDSHRAYYNGTTRIVHPGYLGANNANGSFTAVFPTLPPHSNLDPNGTQVEGYASKDYPRGDGVGTVTVTKAGSVTLTGTLADGTVVTASSALSETDTFPLFAQLYGKQGCITGTVQLAFFLPDSDMAVVDQLWWLRPFQPTSHYYPYGWVNGIKAGFVAARYVAASGQSVLKVTNGAILGAPDADGNVHLTFSDGQLSESLFKAANLSTADIVTKVPGNDTTFTMLVNRLTGAVTGTFVHTDDTMPGFSARIYQKGPNAGAYGYFLTKQPVPINYTGESGGFSLIGDP